MPSFDDLLYLRGECSSIVQIFADQPTTHRASTRASPLITSSPKRIRWRLCAFPWIIDVFLSGVAFCLVIWGLLAILCWQCASTRPWYLVNISYLYAWLNCLLQPCTLSSLTSAIVTNRSLNPMETILLLIKSRWIGANTETIPMQLTIHPRLDTLTDSDFRSSMKCSSSASICRAL